MRAFLILAAFTILWSCQKAGPSGTVKLVENKDRDSLVIERGFMRGDQKIGAWSTFHTGSDYGRIKTLSNYIDGQLFGTYMEFSNRGQLTLEANYVDNKLDGRWAKYEFGRILEEAMYKNGQLNGTYYQYYGSNKPQKQIEYKDGKLDGIYRYFDEQGNILMDYVYKAGEKVSGKLLQSDTDSTQVQ